ncbi:MAG: DUF72 domain-containing protein [Gammaproteobacteria bacterium]|nr:DUF72 domain-containing protein [Gammaproteobacteria bacterium]
MSETISLPGFEPPAPVAPAPTDVALQALQAQRPNGLFVGTSSWSFPGWAGLVYADTVYRQTQLAQHGLAAYASHPLLNAVSIDRTFYRSMDAVDYAAYREDVPETFRFVVKADQLCTTTRLRGAEQLNPHFLDADFARQRVVGPALDGLGTTLGAIVFQFPPQALHGLNGLEQLFARLDEFVGALPLGPTYALEFRDSQWLTDDYLTLLKKHKIRHCICVHPRMPRPRAQWRYAGAVKGPTIVRWNLGHGLDYELAKSRYAPFNKMLEPDKATRREIAQICARSLAFAQPTFVTINNKAEGCAPLSARALVDAVIAVEST